MACSIVFLMSCHCRSAIRCWRLRSQEGLAAEACEVPDRQSIGDLQLWWPANAHLTAAPSMDKGIARRLRIDSGRAVLARLWAANRGADSPRGLPMKRSARLRF